MRTEFFLEYRLPRLRLPPSCLIFRTMERRAPRIFISYARRDGRPYAERLHVLLQAHDLTSWHDKQSIGAGDILPQVLRAIEASEHLALILSPGALGSDWVKREWTHARLHGKSVSPILADPNLTYADLPSWAQREQIFNLDNQDDRHLLIEVLKRPGRVRRVPYMFGHLTEDFVSRPHEFERLKQAVLAGPGKDSVGLTTALRGAGGYGKTSLANSLCRDPDIRFEFADGILRVDIGRERDDVTSLIVDLIEKLDPEQKRPGFANLETAAEHFAELVGEARLLLVIDDVWREAQLRPFLRGGPNCVRLITTRRPEILPQGCTPVIIDALRVGESLQIMSANLPGADNAANSAKLRSLTDRLGNWAQMLRIANGWLRERVSAGEGLSDAISRFDARLNRFGLSIGGPTDEAQRTSVIRACFEPSFEELGNNLPRFCELAILPEDEEIPLETIAKLWAETAGLHPEDADDLFVRFHGLSLLQNLDLGRRTLTLHDNMLWYLRDRAGQASRRHAHAAMVQALARRCDGVWANAPAADVYGWRYLIWHLRQAGDDEQADRLLIDFDWIKAKLSASGPQNLFESYVQPAASEAAHLVGRAIAMSLPTLAASRQELARQLFGRLGSASGADIKALVAAARCDPDFWPAPRWPAQSSPGAELLRLAGHKGHVNEAAFSPDGSRVVTASKDTTARIWDALTGQEIACLHHQIELNGARFSPDGTRIVTACTDTTARLWDVVTGTQIAILRGHQGSVRGATFSPDGSVIVTESADATARVWATATGQEIAVLHGHERPVNCASFSHDGNRIITASDDKTLRVWNAATGQEIAILCAHEDYAARSVSFSPDARHIVTASTDTTARTWNSTTGKQITVFLGHQNQVNGANFSPDGSHVVTASDDKTARVWDAASGQEISILHGHEDWVCSANFSPDGNHIVTASADRTVRLWLASMLPQAPDSFGHDGPVNSLDFSPDGTRLVTTSDDKTVRLWDAATGKPITILQGHLSGVKSASFSLDGSRIVSASIGASARVWEADTGEQVAILRGHGTGLNCASFSPDGTRIITASYDKTARLWDAVSGQEIAILRGHSSAVNSARFSPDGTHMVTASDDKTARLWDTSTCREVGALCGHTSGLNSARYSLDGSRIVSASYDKTARIWDAGTGQEIAVLRGHKDWLRGANFFPNGNRIVTISYDKTARIWNSLTGLEVARITLETAITASAVHGAALALGDSLGRICIYDGVK